MRFVRFLTPFLGVVGVFCLPLDLLAATITVTGTGDSIAVDGVVTLREAITSINNGSNVNADVVAVGTYGVNDTIVFAIPGAGVHTISPASSLPTIVQRLVINGYSQPGASANTLAVGDNSVLQIELSGTGTGIGLDITATGVQIRGLSIHSFNSNIRILSGGGGHTFTGNFIGISPAGAATPSNGAGLLVGTSNNTIGGTATADRNIISGNPASGILLEGASNNVVQGNYIGTNPAGTAAIPNAYGIEIAFGSTGNMIGGTTSGARNLISGNNSPALRSESPSNVLQGNLIGTDATGSLPLGNGSGGLIIVDSNNTIGGTVLGAGNVIAFNNGVGVQVLAGTGDSILGNSIFSNTGLGIDLGGDGVTANDACDADTGANNLQNYPILTMAFSSGGTTNIQGTLNSVASTMHRIEFFSNGTCDPSGYGEGETYLGFTDVTTDGSCNASFNVDLPVAVPPDMHVTATATDPSGNTSEFSACIPLATRYYTITPCRVADTRNPAGPYGGPALAAKTARTFVVGGQCGIPIDAAAVSFNFTITEPTAQGDLRTFPGGAALPLVSTLNWVTNQTRANNAVVPLGPAGDLVARVDQASGTAQFIIDVNGYFR